MRLHTLNLLVKRDFQERYKGSLLGLIWAIINPLMLLAIYTIVFSQVFKLRWGGNPTSSQFDFSITLFCGLMVFNVFAEVFGRSTIAISSHANYVRKMVFPLTLLPLICVVTALINFGLSFIVWFVFFLFVNGLPSVNSLLLPVVFIPLIIGGVGVSYLLSSMNVFYRDLSQLTGIATTALLFLSPIFYERSMVPFYLQNILAINPLTKIIENFRDVMIWGKTPSALDLGIPVLLSLIIFALGFSCFSRLKSRFADSV